MREDETGDAKMKSTWFYRFSIFTCLTLKFESMLFVWHLDLTL